MVPPEGWVVFDWKGAETPNDAVLEFHAAPASFGFNDLANYKFPYLRIQWQGEEINTPTSEQLKAVTKLNLGEGVELVKEGPRRVAGRYDAYQWVFQEGDSKGWSKYSMTVFGAGGRMFTVRFEGSRDQYGRLLSKAEESLRTFKVLR